MIIETEKKYATVLTCTIFCAFFLLLRAFNVYSQSEDEIMPSFLSGVYIGIDKDMLIKMRSIDRWMGESIESSNLLFENFDQSPLFDNIIYSFQENSGRLQWVTILKESSGDYIEKNYRILLNKAIQKWGIDYQINTHTMKHSGREYKGISLSWKKKEATIIVSFTPPEQIIPTKKAGMTIRIADPNLHVNDLLKSVKMPAGHDLEKIKDIISSIDVSDRAGNVL